MVRQNWGVQPFPSVLSFSFWGHARLGPYSIVWSDLVAPSGKEYVSGFLYNHSKVLKSSCSGVKVRPFNAPKIPFPATVTSPKPKALQITMDLGKSEGIFEAVVTNTRVIEDALGLYSRWIGEIKGGIKGEKSYSGSALYEEFTFLGFSGPL